MKAVSGNTWGANKKFLLVIYRGLIRSILDYGAIAFDSMNNTNKQKLDSIQARAIRIVCGAARGTPTAALQVDTGNHLFSCGDCNSSFNMQLKLNQLKTTRRLMYSSHIG